MRFILDTHVLVWAASEPHKIPARHRNILTDPDNDLAYSVAALWEVVVKNGTRRSLEVEPRLFQQRLQENGYTEIPIIAEHAFAVSRLPRIHGDPFDRILIAQALVEDRILVTANLKMLQYPGVKTVALHGKDRN